MINNSVGIKKIKKDKITIRLAWKNEIFKIHKIFLEAFKPYKKYYTKKAYDATVISPRQINDRLLDNEVYILVAIYNSEIVGTVSVNKEDSSSFYICSMAVKPSFQGKGIGSYLLEEIIKLSVEKKVKTLSLESYDPLEKALNFYEFFGFEKTGKNRNYHGIEIFEMIKHIKD